MKENISNVYREYLVSLICDSRHSYRSYSYLLDKLYTTEFYYSIELDGNRYEDGIGLRYSFGRDNNIPDAVIATCLDRAPCSVLEMMTALALRCENEIMCDPDKGSRVGVWFWGMIKSLKLDCMTNADFEEAYVEERTHILLERRYKRNGEGGLFTIADCPHDLRSTEIWYQAMWYLNKYRED